MRKSLLAFLIVLLSISLVAGTSCAPQFTKEKLISSLSDGKYDLSYRLLDLKGLDSNSLTRWVRPVTPALLDKQGRAVAYANKKGIGMLLGRYVIVSAGLFANLPPKSLMPPGADATQLHIGAILIWDVLPGGMVYFEPLEIVFADKESGVGLLIRSPSSRFPAGPEEFPYKIGNSAELEEFSAFINIGYNYFQNREMAGGIFSIERARLTVLPSKESKFGFQGSVTYGDWGSPLFGIRDGEPEFIGIVTGSYLVQQEETRGFGLTVEKLLSVIQERGSIAPGGEK